LQSNTNYLGVVNKIIESINTKDDNLSMKDVREVLEESCKGMYPVEKSMSRDDY